MNHARTGRLEKDWSVSYSPSGGGEHGTLRKQRRLSEGEWEDSGAGDRNIAPRKRLEAATEEGELKNIRISDRPSTSNSLLDRMGGKPSSSPNINKNSASAIRLSGRRLIDRVARMDDGGDDGDGRRSLTTIRGAEERVSVKPNGKLLSSLAHPESSLVR